jgi:hypothetical protein
MEVVSNRYDNFKRFIKSIVKKDNEFINKFMNTQLDFFLDAIKSKLSNGYTKEQCIDEIFLASETKKEDYSEEDFKKACRYMDYFTQVVLVTVK